jgi:hypothetical protein
MIKYKDLDSLEGVELEKAIFEVNLNSINELTQEQKAILCKINYKKAEAQEPESEVMSLVDLISSKLFKKKKFNQKKTDLKDRLQGCIKPIKKEGEM